MPLFFLAALASFRLLDTAGGAHGPEEWAGKKATVVFFILTDCPLSNGYVPEMNRIRQEYEKRGVAVYATHTDSTVTDADVRKHVKEFGYTFPVLLDPKGILAKITGARVVPEAAILSPSGDVQYLGRIDNLVEDLTKRRPAATEHELRDALDAVLAGKAPKAARTRAVGCALEVNP